MIYGRKDRTEDRVVAPINHDNPPNKKKRKNIRVNFCRLQNGFLLR